MPKTFKTVTEFKKILTVGDRLACVYHQQFAGRDADSQPIWADEDKGVREVSIKQTNSFALKTTQKDGKVVDSWCGYPTAAFSVVKDNKITLLQRDGRLFKGGHADESNPEYAALPLIPILTYWFVD